MNKTSSPRVAEWWSASEDRWVSSCGHFKLVVRKCGIDHYEATVTVGEGRNASVAAFIPAYSLASAQVQAGDWARFHCRSTVDSFEQLGMDR